MEDLMDLTDREKQFMVDRDQLAAEKQRILEDKQRAEEEFGKIRAKFKDLYLQREAEISKLKAEKQRVENEIADVRTAAVVSQSTAQEEIDALARRHNEELRQYKQQLLEARDKLQQQSRALKNENEDTENLESSMLKAQKDTEMLKEIIVPLETELKEVKLQCQQLMAENMRMREQQSKDSRPQPTVDMLLDLEEDLGGTELGIEVHSREQVEELEREIEEEKQRSASLKEVTSLQEQQLEEHRKRDEELNRQVVELQEEVTLKNTELEELKRSVQTTEAKWTDLTQRFTEKVDHVSEDFKSLRDSHKTAESDLSIFKTKHTAEMEEFENFKAKLTEDFEKLKMKLSDERKTHEDAQALLTDSLESCRQEILRLEGVSDELQTSRELCEKLQNDVVNVTDKLNESQRKSKEVILGLQKQLLACGAEKEEHMARIARLGKELSESLSVRDELAVQSSELQVQLEAHRELLKNIKWEHEDDVTHCRGCDVAFSMTKRKSHCRKCGRIFCTECCAGTIEFGANKRQYKACAECVKRHRAEMPAEYHTVTVPSS